MCPMVLLYLFVSLPASNQQEIIIACLTNPLCCAGCGNVQGLPATIHTGRLQASG